MGRDENGDDRDEDAALYWIGLDGQYSTDSIINCMNGIVWIILYIGQYYIKQY